MHRDSSAISALVLVVLLVTAGCGPAAAPTAIPSPIPTAAVTKLAQPRAPTPAAALSLPQQELTGSSFYSQEKVRQLLAEHYLLGTMMYGKGEEPQYGGVAIFAHRGDIPNSDPMFAAITLHGLSNKTSGEGNLVRPKRSNNFETEGYLAHSWEASADFTQWTFQLRPNIKWHDGTPLTAPDIKFWIDLANFPPAGRRTAYVGFFGQLKEVQVVGPLTLRLIEKEPTPFLLETMSGYNTTVGHPRHLAQPIIDKGNARVQMSDFAWVGLGPFKFDKYDAGSRMRVVRNPDYFEKDEEGRSLPYLDGIENPIIPDQQTMVSAFRAGKLDQTARGNQYHLTETQVAAVGKSLGDRAWFARTPNPGLNGGFSMNASKPPFNDIRLRKAVQLFMDPQEGAQLSYGGLGIVRGYLAVGSFWYNPDVLTWPGYNPASKKQDQEEARRLLKASGYAGANVTILSLDIYVNQAQINDAQFRRLGLNPFIEVVDANQRDERSQRGDYQVHEAGGAGSSPGKLLESWVTTNPLSTTKHGDTKIDEYNRLLQTTVDPMKRREVAWEAEKYIILDKAYAIPLYGEEAVVGFRTRIKGVWVPNDTILQNNDHTWTWIDQKAK